MARFCSPGASGHEPADARTATSSRRRRTTDHRAPHRDGRRGESRPRTRPKGQIRGLQSEQELRPARSQSPPSGPRRPRSARPSARCLGGSSRQARDQSAGVGGAAQGLRSRLGDHHPRHSGRPIRWNLHRPRLEPVARMMKAVLVGVAAVPSVIAGAMGADKVLAMREGRSNAAVTKATEARKTHEINVPRIKDGAIKGYAVMLLSYTVDLSALKTAAIAPDSILVDEAFRYVYSDDTIDFDHLDRFDFAKMSKALVGAINARVKSDVVVDVGVQEFTYEPVSEPRGPPAPEPARVASALEAAIKSTNRRKR